MGRPVLLTPYLTARQVADLFQVNVETVYDLISRDGLPATKLGGSWRFDETELCSWFKAHRSREPPTVKRKDER